jgi:DNA ligase (NAD+)
MTAIEKSKKIAFGRFLYSLGIRHVGENIADILAGKWGSLDVLMQQSSESLSEVEGIGMTIAESVHGFFSNPVNRAVLNKILENGVEILSRATARSRLLEGKSFVLTGTLPTMTRNQAKTLIEAAGGKIVAAVSRNTSYLVVGESAGSKLEAARKLNIEIMDESALLKLLGKDGV